MYVLKASGQKCGYMGILKGENNNFSIKVKRFSCIKLKKLTSKAFFSMVDQILKDRHPNLT